MANRYYTIMLVPEGTSNVRRFVIPTWVLRGVSVTAFFGIALGFMMILDYWYVMNQIELNKDLQIENRRLLQHVEVLQTKMEGIDETLERIKRFSTRLKVITNIGEYRDLIQSLNENLPDSSTNIHAEQPLSIRPFYDKMAEKDDVIGTEAYAGDQEKSRFFSAETLGNQLPHERDETFQALDDRISRSHFESLQVEHEVQDIHELLIDQDRFLRALPTVRPAEGYVRSGFGTRRGVDLGGRPKMHEGIDIANENGTPIIATADGVVHFAGVRPGYGQTVVINHDYGLQTWYGHSQKLVVKKGDPITRGQTIALMGNSGRASGTHVHYEVRLNQIPVDPLAYFLSE